MTGAQILIRGLAAAFMADVAAALDCRGFHVEWAGGLRPAPETALASPVPALVDCPVDDAENDRPVEL